MELVAQECHPGWDCNQAEGRGEIRAGSGLRYQARGTHGQLHSGLQCIFKEKHILNHLLGFGQCSWVDKRTGSTTRLPKFQPWLCFFLALNLDESRNFSMDTGMMLVSTLSAC